MLFVLFCFVLVMPGFVVLFVLNFCLFVVFCEIGSLTVLDGLELREIHLPLPPKCRD